METINLQGIIASESKELRTLRSKNLALREMVGLQHGVEVEAGSSILESLSRDQLKAAEYLCTYLDGQQGGGDTLDTIFQAATSFSGLSRQLSMIGDLINELDSLAPENDFEGRKEARSMLANLSLRLKKTARIATTRRPGRLRPFR